MQYATLIVFDRATDQFQVVVEAFDAVERVHVDVAAEDHEVVEEAVEEAGDVDDFFVADAGDEEVGGGGFDAYWLHLIEGETVLVVVLIVLDACLK